MIFPELDSNSDRINVLYSIIGKYNDIVGNLYKIDVCLTPEEATALGTQIDTWYSDVKGIISNIEDATCGTQILNAVVPYSMITVGVGLSIDSSSGVNVMDSAPIVTTPDASSSDTSSDDTSSTDSSSIDSSDSSTDSSNISSDTSSVSTDTSSADSSSVSTDTSSISTDSSSVVSSDTSSTPTDSSSVSASS